MEMEITLKSNYGFELIFEAENVKVTEDIEERIYRKDENGKTDYSFCKRDIKKEVLDKISSVLDEMIYYRKEVYDSTQLIESLLAKLPEDKFDTLLHNVISLYDVKVSK